MVKLVKFNKIKNLIDEIAKEYETAKENNDTELMAVLEENFKAAKIVLFSNEKYFNDLKKSEVKQAIALEESEQNQNYLRAELQQKKAYKSNISYIDMVEKSSSLDKYIELKSHKKRNFVKRHFKKFLLGAAVVAAMVGLTKCHNDKKDKKQDKINPTEISIDQNAVDQNTTEDINSNTEEETLTTETTKEEITSDKEIDNANKDKIEDLIPSSETIVEEHEVDPELPKDTLNKKPTTTTVNITEPTVPEQPEVEYPADKNNDKPSKENTSGQRPSVVPEQPEVEYPTDNKEETKPSKEENKEDKKEDKKEDNKDKNDNKTPSASEAAGNNIEEDPSIKYPIKENDKIDPNCPPAPELPKDEIIHTEEKEIVPSIKPEDTDKNKIDESINDKEIIHNNGETTIKPSQSASEAAGNIIEEDEETVGFKYYNQDGEVIFYENEGILEIDGEPLVLRLR